MPCSRDLDSPKRDFDKTPNDGTPHDSLEQDRKHFSQCPWSGLRVSAIFRYLIPMVARAPWHPHLCLYRPPQVGQGLLSAEGSCTPDAGDVRTPQCSPEYLTGVRDSPNFSRLDSEGSLQEEEWPIAEGGGPYCNWRRGLLQSLEGMGN